MAKSVKSFQDTVRQYETDRPNYEALAGYVAELIRRSSPKGIIHTVEYRAKATTSFEKKCQKTNEDGTLRYPNASADITDLAGVRVIVFTRESVDIACDLITEMFDVFEVEDVGERVYQKGRFGYQSKHLLLRLGDDRKNLRENADFSTLTCEVQVRTILQHAWAELEHDIQYKSVSDIPIDLNKRFSALAGLLEIADREFQSIQNDSAAVRDRVKAGLLSDLTKEGLSQREKKGEALEETAENVRELITHGRIVDAIKSFDDKIKLSPSSYTHYIGRAKARFLAGDVRSAIADLDKADELAGTGRYTDRLRTLIEIGDTRQIASSYGASPGQIAEELKGAVAALSAGDGVRAFEHYEALEAANFNRAIVLFGKAVCCALERDTTGAASFLSSLKLRPGTPMAVNLHALRAVIATLNNANPEEYIAQLRVALTEAPQYMLNASPLKALFTGLSVKRYPEQQTLTQIEKILSDRLPE